MQHKAPKLAALYIFLFLVLGPCFCLGTGIIGWENPMSRILFDSWDHCLTDWGFHFALLILTFGSLIKGRQKKRPVFPGAPR